MRRPKFLDTILGVVIGAAACSAEQPPPMQPSLLGGVSDVLTVLTCSPLPATTSSAVIGPAGGTLMVGPHKLVVPSGALAYDVKITASIPSEQNNSIVFQPEGLQFARTSSLTMSYANCLLPPVLALSVVYTDDALNILEVLSSSLDLRNQTVTGKLRHFSRYAVAY